MPYPDRKPPTPLFNLEPAEVALSASWLEFIRYCHTLGHGEIDKLYIQDGVPVLAEVITRKIRFTRER